MRFYSLYSSLRTVLLATLKLRPLDFLLLALSWYLYNGFLVSLLISIKVLWNADLSSFMITFALFQMVLERLYWPEIPSYDTQLRDTQLRFPATVPSYDTQLRDSQLRYTQLRILATIPSYDTQLRDTQLRYTQLRFPATIPSYDTQLRDTQLRYTQLRFPA